MVYSVAMDRCQSLRYLVVGTAALETAQGDIEADLVNIGPGGLLAFCDATLELGEQVHVRFTLDDFPLLVRTQGRVDHAEAGLVGIRFLEEPEALEEILLWLEAGSLPHLP